MAPTCRSLLLMFDPVALPRRDLVRSVEALWPPDLAAEVEAPP